MLFYVPIDMERDLFSLPQCMCAHLLLQLSPSVDLSKQCRDYPLSYVILCYHMFSLIWNVTCSPYLSVCVHTYRYSLALQ